MACQKQAGTTRSFLIRKANSPPPLDEDHKFHAPNLLNRNFIPTAARKACTFVPLKGGPPTPLSVTSNLRKGQNETDSSM